MRIRRILEIILSALVGGCVAFIVFLFLMNNKNSTSTISSKTKEISSSNKSSSMLDLSDAAEFSVKTVVHVETIYNRNTDSTKDLYDFLFGFSKRKRAAQPSMSSGSGVIVTSDGYIVTNNHVIEGASEILVTLYDKRNFEAELVGQDPVSDLALLKIKSEKLPVLKFGDSDKLKLGEWVLAVGNPFNLTSTVTAGIISAKARDIGLSRKNKMSIESFLQTDAAVNPGNSGGALVNSHGQLVGINTAIESKTGSYTGYSFAIPSSIVKKVVGDLIKYKKVQRAFIGISIVGVDSQIAHEKSLNEIKGVYILSVAKSGAAELAGLEEGDIVLAINSKAVNSNPQFLEQISTYNPGDKVEFTILRGKESKHIDVLLRNKDGEEKLIFNEDAILLGAKLKPITKQEQNMLKIKTGLKVLDLSEGKFKEIGIQKGFIIYKINNTIIKNIGDIKKIIEKDRGEGIFISGVYPNGKVKYYAFSMIN